MDEIDANGGGDVTKSNTDHKCDPKTENMDDSGFGTCSSAATTVDDHSESHTPDENPKYDNGLDLEAINSDNFGNSEKTQCAESMDKDALPTAPVCEEAAEQSKRDGEDLVATLQKDLSESAGNMSCDPETGDGKQITSEKRASLFKKRQCKIKSKRRKEDEEMACDTPDNESGEAAANDSSPTNPKKAKTGEDLVGSESDEFVDARDDLEEKLKKKWSEASSSSLSSPSDSSDEGKEENKQAKEEEEKLWLEKDIFQLPMPKWKAIKELRERQWNGYTHYWPYKVCGSIAMVKRFELQHELVKHEGCVNALHMNQSGTLLASGSDDLNIVLWDWWSRKGGHPVVTYESGHRSNVFQVKFMPESGDATVVSTARDGQVRVASISSTGTCSSTKKIAQHRGSAHKLALDVDSKSTFLSCGEDGVVFGIDLRMDKQASKLVTVKTGSKKIPLYSIHVNPSRPTEFAVSGRDNKAHVFDRRKIDEDANLPTVKTYCPQHLQDAPNVKANITCLVYNWDGSEILCSYNDEDIYLFDTSHSDGADYTKRYKGHRNNATVKGVNFYGPHSEFVVSGSDCGNIFFWEKQSSRIVHLMEGDKGGVVNVLEPHPSLPVLATSGLDHEVKIWSPTVPSNLFVPKMKELKELMLSNRREREEEMRSMTDMIDGQMLWFLMRTLRNRTRRRAAAERREQNDDTSSDSELSDSTNSSSSSEDLGENYREPRCIQS